jgi:phage protein D
MCIRDSYFGYGGSLGAGAEWVGRSVVRKYNPSLMIEEISTLELTGYDGSFKLMEQGGGGRIFGTPEKGMTYSEIVEEIAYFHGMQPTVDAVTAPEVKIVHKAEDTDFQLIASLAAQKGFEFSVAWSDQAQTWVLTWGEPAATTQLDSFEFVFDPRAGSGVALKNIELDLSLQQLKSGVSVDYFDRSKMTWERMEIEETGTKMKFVNKDKIEESLEDAASFRLSFEEKAIEVVPAQKFNSAEEAYDWAQHWYRKRKNELIIAQGTTIGLPTLMAGQVHTIKGVGNLLTGDYLFASVKHKWGSSGYSCDFVARKILKDSV